MMLPDRKRQLFPDFVSRESFGLQENAFFRREYCRTNFFTVFPVAESLFLLP